ncbi:MAG: ATP-dependent RNA helicase HelY, partial [Glaciecola sp.]
LKGVRVPQDVLEGRSRAPKEPLDKDGHQEVEDLRLQVHAHPCHGDPARHDIERWQFRYDEAAKEANRIRSDVERRTGSLVRQLHRILAVLGDLKYIDQDHQPTQAGLVLAGIHGELDLLGAECVRRGLFDDLQAAELAGIASLFTYQARRDETHHVELPTETMRHVYAEIISAAKELRDLETVNGVDALRELDGGFVGAAYRWAGGSPLEDAVGSALEMTGGDFVRNVKQIVDVVGQLRHVGGEELTATAALTLDRLRRGIVDS